MRTALQDIMTRVAATCDATGVPRSMPLVLILVGSLSVFVTYEFTELGLCVCLALSGMITLTPLVIVAGCVGVAVSQATESLLGAYSEDGAR